MSGLLPPNPSLEQLRKQAKDALKDHRAGKASVCDMLRRMRRFASAGDQEILAAKLGLQEVQFALAMDYGFADWTRLARHVEQGPPKDSMLPGLTWRQRYVAMLGCIKGSLEYLGIDITWPWLYGGTAWGMVINIHGQDVDVSGPCAWRWQRLFGLAHNLGYEVVTGEDVSMKAAGDDFPRRQRHAWDFVREHIKGGIPCFGWQLPPWIPDHYVICGYNDVGYYWSGWGSDEPQGPRPWQELGTTDVTTLQVFAVRPREPAEPAQVVKDAAAAALLHAGEGAGSGSSFTSSKEYASGPAAFDNWAAGLEAGTALVDHHTYNAQVWHECRAMAAEFFLEARAKLPPSMDALLRNAAKNYAAVRDALQEAVGLNPPREKQDWKATLRSPEAAAIIRQAGAAEREALTCLERIAAASPPGPR